MAKKRNNSRAKSRVCIRGDHLVSGEEIMCGRCCGVAGSDRLVSSGSCLLFSLVCSLSCSPCMASSSSLQMAFSGHMTPKCHQPLDFTQSCHVQLQCPATTLCATICLPDLVTLLLSTSSPSLSVSSSNHPDRLWWDVLGQGPHPDPISSSDVGLSPGRNEAVCACPLYRGYLHVEKDNHWRLRANTHRWMRRQIRKGSHCIRQPVIFNFHLGYIEDFMFVHYEALCFLLSSPSSYHWGSLPS